MASAKMAEPLSNDFIRCSPQNPPKRARWRQSASLGSDIMRPANGHANIVRTNPPGRGNLPEIGAATGSNPAARV
jgi:hypothetical protein